VPWRRRRGPTAGTDGTFASAAAHLPKRFFDHDKADLTPMQDFLGAYAKAYRGKVTEKIVLEGWASMDGDKDWNKTLSLKRAAQVATFLVGQKVPRAQVTFDGKGRTADFAPDNPCLNRRVTLRPKLDLKVRDFVDVTQEEPRNVPTGKKPTNTLGEPAPTSNDFDLPTPPDTVSRELVRKELEDWLRELGKSQGVKSRDYDVLSTSRVYVAEETLLGRPLGEDLELPSKTPANGDERGYTAKDLADRIANNLPERILKELHELREDAREGGEEAEVDRRSDRRRVRREGRRHPGRLRRAAEVLEGHQGFRQEAHPRRDRQAADRRRPEGPRQEGLREDPRGRQRQVTAAS
jgi:hypothetical protein